MILHCATAHDCTIVLLLMLKAQLGLALNTAKNDDAIPLAAKRTPVKVYEPPLNELTGTLGAVRLAVPFNIKLPVVGGLL